MKPSSGEAHFISKTRQRTVEHQWVTLVMMNHLGSNVCCRIMKEKYFSPDYCRENLEKNEHFKARF